MPHTPGTPQLPRLAPLPAVDAELEALAGHFPRDRFTRLLGPRATRAAVLRELATHSWIHLACHGGQNLTNPADGAVYLHDGPLTVLQIAALRLRDAELAFLSACQTAVGGVRLLDEAIHLAAALQLAGYRNVIATQWSIDDSHAPEVTASVYRTLTATGQPDATQAARALHHAVRALRQAYPDQPLVWAPYLHTGA
jgi:CHAT domain-containing protein